MTRLIVCCDGTWNTPDEEVHGQVTPTNVAKLARAVATGEGSGQTLFYEPGVGTTPDDHLVGGAFGLGLSQNIRNAYRFLAQTYRPGDEIFLFGFSRGAYTARSLAGLIRNCGILRPQDADRVDDAFALYRDRTARTKPDSLASELFREMYAQESDEILFIGVWDTVGALGIPKGMPGWSEISRHMPDWERLWGFHDTQLGPHVRNAYHALAIDEERLPFKPTLWTRKAVPSQTLEQVWFAGVHTEIGGGSASSCLSDIALLWMIDRATSHGLALRGGELHITTAGNAGRPSVSPNYAGPIVNSRHGAYDALHAYHRLREISPDDGPGQSLASSVTLRYENPAMNYAPPGLDLRPKRAA
jgi:uncharacterized protein (DUF2235 family)